MLFRSTSAAAFLKHPFFWLIILSGALHNFNAYAINSFLTAFLSRYHQLTIKTAGQISAVVLGAVGVFGLLMGGWLSDRFGQRRIDGRLNVGALAMLAGAPAIFLALRQPPGAIIPFMAFMGFGIMLTFIYYSAVYPAIQDYAPPQLRGRAMAIYFFAMYVFGASFGPVVLGKLSDHFATAAMQSAGAAVMDEAFRAAGLHRAMHIIPGLCAALGLVLALASQSAAKLDPVSHRGDQGGTTNEFSASKTAS